MLVTKFFSLHKSKICVYQKKVVTLHSKSFANLCDFKIVNMNFKNIAYEKNLVCISACMCSMQLFV